MEPGVSIVAHCLVKNEERFVWYAINSVLPYVDQIMIWDTGSTDNTVKIIKTIKDKKIKLKQLESVNVHSFTALRQEMLRQTPKSFTWLMILDGDEIWSSRSIATATRYCRENPQEESVVVRTNNLVGDIYHKLPESAGRYQLAGRTGHLNLRFINLKKIPGLNVQKPHGQQGYYDNRGKLIQDRSPIFLDVSYHHATHLQRSASRLADRSVIKRSKKYKYELGKIISRSEIPEIFFLSHPDMVPDVSQAASAKFWFISALITPFKFIRRKFLPIEHGY